EYGYALDSPEALVIWEAQFGDFANGAQVMFDQFISASEDKWDRLSAVTLLLPHGFEGQGPEHSSARLERFLQLCAEDNMQVANLTTPAQIFHALRRQVVRKWRKPLVVMTPKSLLRHKRAVSYRADFVEGRFHRVIPEAHLSEDECKSVKRAILCSGKVFYDLLERRDETGDNTAALIRVEQLYPFPGDQILEAIGQLPSLEEIVWCQEEPANMGARNFLHPLFSELFSDGPPLRWVSREASASPATGSAKAHKLEQADLLDRAFCRKAAKTRHAKVG
ncbi:MAG: 2-oxoglutarate dehydrogenase E1 component, partial [Myxococcota bacterium]